MYPNLRDLIERLREFSPRAHADLHDASPGLLAEVAELLTDEPALWRPYHEGRQDGWVTVNADGPRGGRISVAVHGLPRPAGWRDEHDLCEMSRLQDDAGRRVLGAVPELPRLPVARLNRRTAETIPPPIPGAA